MVKGQGRCNATTLPATKKGAKKPKEDFDDRAARLVSKGEERKLRGRFKVVCLVLKGNADLQAEAEQMLER